MIEVLWCQGGHRLLKSELAYEIDYLPVLVQDALDDLALMIAYPECTWLRELLPEIDLHLVLKTKNGQTLYSSKCHYSPLLKGSFRLGINQEQFSRFSRAHLTHVAYEYFESLDPFEHSPLAHFFKGAKELKMVYFDFGASELALMNPILELRAYNRATRRCSICGDISSKVWEYGYCIDCARQCRLHSSEVNLEFDPASIQSVKAVECHKLYSSSIITAEGVIEWYDPDVPF